MKTLLKRIVVLSLALVLCIPTFAEADGIRVVVNGEQVDFTGDQPPVIDSAGRTLVPVRKVFEKLGSDVTIGYDETTRTVMMSKGITNLALYIGESDLAIEEFGEVRYVEMDTVPVIMNDRTMLPARFVAEALGAQVGWDEATRTVTIDSDYEVVGGFVGDADLFTIRRDGKYGCIDRNRRIVVPIMYNSIRFNEFSETQNSAVSSTYNNSVYAMATVTETNAAGQEVKKYLGIVREHTNGEGEFVPARLDTFDDVEAVPSNHNYLFVSVGGKWGILGMSGETATAIEYEEKPVLMNYNGALKFKVKKNGLYGISSLDNKLITDIKYNMIGVVDFTVSGNPVTYYQEGYVCAMRNGVFGYIDMEGREVYPFDFADVTPFKNGKATVKQNGRERQIQISESGRITFLPDKNDD